MHASSNHIFGPFCISQLMPCSDCSRPLHAHHTLCWAGQKLIRCNVSEGVFPELANETCLSHRSVARHFICHITSGFRLSVASCPTSTDGNGRQKPCVFRCFPNMSHKFPAGSAIEPLNRTAQLLGSVRGGLKQHGFGVHCVCQVWPCKFQAIGILSFIPLESRPAL